MRKFSIPFFNDFLTGMQTLNKFKWSSLKCFALMLVECYRKKYYNIEQSNQTIYADTAKQKVCSSFCNTIQSPVHRKTLEYAAFSIRPSDNGQCGLFQNKYLSDSVLKGGCDIGVNGDAGCQGFATQLLQIIMQFLNLAEKVGTSSPLSTYLPVCFN